MRFGIQHGLNVGQMIETVAKGVVLDEELGREGRMGIEGYGYGIVQIGIRKGAHAVCRGLAVVSQQLEGFLFADAGVPLGMVGIHLVDHIPRHAGDRIAGRNRFNSE